MQRLIKDASQMTDVQEKLNITVDGTSMSFDNVVNAISVVQEKLGIAGTSAKEGTETIEGSMNRMKAAWSNLITGMADKNADVAALTKTFVDTLVGGVDEAGNHVNGALDNIMPAVQRTLESFGEIFSALGQTLPQKLAEIAQTALPIFFETVINLMASFVETIPQIIPSLVESLHVVISGIGEKLPEMFRTLGEFFSDALPELIPAITNIIMELALLLTSPDMITTIVDAAIKIAIAAVEGVIAALPELIRNIGPIVANLVESLLDLLPVLAEGVFNLLMDIIKAIPGFIVDIGGLLYGLGEGIFDGIKSFGENIGQELYRLFTGWWDTMCKIWEPMVSFFGSLWEGIQDVFGSIASWFGKVFSDAWENIKKVFSVTGEIFGNIGKSIVNALSSVINGIIWGINQVIKLPIEGLNAILRLIHDIDIFGLRPFEWIGQIPIPEIPSIPMLAEGGVLKQGQVALLEGEGDEAVIPLSKNTEWLDSVADRLSRKLESDGQQSNYYNIHVEVANMNANSREEIEKLAETLMQIMSEKTTRRGAAFR